MKVFVSYASGESEEHRLIVRSFTDFLRKNGYNAIIDEFEMNKQTAIDFFEMMSSNMRSSDKVIIVLSEKYKTKADNFEGGVGVEYKNIIREIHSVNNKYIIGTFTEDSNINETLVKKIAPYDLQGRRVVSLFNEELVIRLLSNKPEFIESEVASSTPNVQTNEIIDFNKLKRLKKNSNFQFDNLLTLTKYEFETETKISYEVFRTIQVTSPRLTTFEIKPRFTCNSVVKVSSIFFPSFDLQMNNENELRFEYPIPKENNKGDIITINYRLDFEDSKKELKPFASFKTENDTRLEIHEIIIRYKNDNPPAKLYKMKTSIDYDFNFIKEIGFNKVSNSYRVEIIDPDPDCFFKLEWIK
jgi:hypothetical protein